MESSTVSRVIIDIREPSLYEASHIKEAVNLLTSSLLIRRLQRGSLTITNLLPEHINARLVNDVCGTIVLYDENSQNGDQNKCLTIISNALKKSFPHKKVFILEKGFKNFCEEYPQFCDFDHPVHNHLQINLQQKDFISDPTDKNTFSPHTDLCPVSILPNLFLGSAHHASQKELLDKLGITAILNVSKTSPSAFANNYQYKNIAIDDNNRENISSHFDSAINFIEDVTSRGGKVLVHCRAGVSRSATICIAFLMRQKGYTLDEAYEYTKKRRSAISPNFNFLGQLLAFEHELAEQRQVNIINNNNNNNNNNGRPSSARFPLPNLTLDLKKAPLTSAQFNKNTEFFSYPPVSKNCMSFFNGPDVSSPCLALMTPS